MSPELRQHLNEMGVATPPPDPAPAPPPHVAWKPSHPGEQPPF